jgi:hypothetical protein
LATTQKQQSNNYDTRITVTLTNVLHENKHRHNRLDLRGATGFTTQQKTSAHPWLKYGFNKLLTVAETDNRRWKSIYTRQNQMLTSYRYQMN